MMNTQSDALLQRVKRITAQTVDNLQRELRNIEQEKRRITADLDDAADRINETLRHLGAPVARAPGRPLGRPVGRPPSFSAPAMTAPAPTRSRKGKRIRRGPEQLKEYAQGIYELIKSKGNQGARGGEIRADFPQVGQDIRGFLQKHGSFKLRTTGDKSLMRYHAA